MYDVHYVRTMPDVCRGNRSGESIQGGHRKHESEGRLRRFRFKYFADGSLQSSGGTDKKSSSGRMQHHVK